MIVEILLLIVGLVLIIAGAEFLVDGSSSIARRFGVSEFVIGLTIVGMGTSAPEMVVSFMGAFQGKADIALGQCDRVEHIQHPSHIRCDLFPHANGHHQAEHEERHPDEYRHHPPSDPSRYAQDLLRHRK